MDTPEGSVVLFQSAHTHRTLFPPAQVYVYNHSVYCSQFLVFPDYAHLLFLIVAFACRDLYLDSPSEDYF